jgi:hypothetical protein
MFFTGLPLWELRIVIVVLPTLFAMTAPFCPTVECRHRSAANRAVQRLRHRTRRHMRRALLRRGRDGGFTFFFGAANVRAQSIMTGGVALLIFSGLLAILAIGYRARERSSSAACAYRYAS